MRAWLNLAESQPLLYSHLQSNSFNGILTRAAEAARISVKGISKHAKLSKDKTLS